MNAGWSKSSIDEFNKTLVILAKESLLIPKLMFQFAKDQLDMDTLQIDNVKGLPLNALSSMVTCVLTNRNNIRRIKLRQMDLGPDATIIFQLLLTSEEKKIIEVDLADNPIKDDGFDNILKSFRINCDQLKVIKILSFGTQFY